MYDRIVPHVPTRIGTPRDRLSLIDCLPLQADRRGPVGPTPHPGPGSVDCGDLGTVAEETRCDVVMGRHGDETDELRSLRSNRIQQ